MDAPPRIPSASGPPSSRTLRVLVGRAAAAVVVSGLRAAADIVGPVVLALVLTIVFHPVRTRLGERVPGWLASFIVLLSAYLVIVVLALAMFVSLGQLVELIPHYKSQLADQFSGIASALESLGVGGKQVQAMGDSVDPGRLAGAASSILGGLFGVLSDVFFIITLLLFLVFDDARTHLLLADARRHRPLLVDAISGFAQGTRSYFGVSAGFGFIVAIIDWVVLLAMGIPGAFAWGVLAFVTNFVPNIGFVIGVIPPALIGLLEGGPELMLAVIAVYSVINFVIQSLIQPRYVGSAVGLSSTLTFLSLVFWTWVLGPLGALLAVPMSLLARAILVDADPEASWLTPIISGKPAEQPADQSAVEPARSGDPEP